MGIEEYVISILPGLPPAVVVIIYLFIKNWDDIKAAARRVYSDQNTHRIDEREANQDIRASQINFELQERATKESRAWAVDSTYLELTKGVINEMFSWAKGDFSQMQGEINDLKKTVNESRDRRVEAFNKLGQKVDAFDDRIRILTAAVSRLEDILRDINKNI